ncbi:hypothetical protein HGA64_04890 [Candidatus Falkowbacteria bacterium]|nr:hypothetical protein [Candidatus Falkowbacteria bacterium]
MALTTSQEKELALEQLRLRQEQNKGKKRINNMMLPAGSPMYYYCESCGEEMVLGELHICAAPTHCKECKALKEAGLIE